METRVHLPRLAAELGDGWSVVEQSHLTSPGGVSITVTLWRAPDGVDAEEVGALDGTELGRELGGLTEVSTSWTTAFGGLRAHERRVRFDRPDGAWSGRIVHVVDDHVVCRVAASWLEGQEHADDEVDRALDGLRLLGRPLPVPWLTPPDEAARGEAPPAASAGSARWRPAVDPAVWAALKATWGGGASPDRTELSHRGSGAGAAVRWSVDELVVAAIALGAPTFPTVPGDFLVSYPEVARGALVGAVTRSLVARGVLVAPDDIAVLTEAFAPALELAVHPDLSIEVVRRTATTSEEWWYGVRPDGAVRVTVAADGTREIAELDPARIVDDLAVLVSLPGLEAFPERATVPGERILSDGSGVRSITWVVTTWRDGSSVAGGIVPWAVHDVGSLSLATIDAADPTRPIWHLRPADSESVRRELLAHLPGG